MREDKDILDAIDKHCKEYGPLKRIVRLKPCPFCEDGEGDPKPQCVSERTIAVCCGYCGCEGPIWGTEEEAIETWNTRR